jgi:hypothetical protein
MPTSHGPYAVTYRLIANGSALVEDWGPGTPRETETIFYPDGSALWLTHFCLQGNQPRLREVPAASSDDTVVFRFVDVTDRTPDEAMLVERRLRLAADGASFDDTEIYANAKPDGTDESTTHHFTRQEHPM